MTGLTSRSTPGSRSLVPPVHSSPHDWPHFVWMIDVGGDSMDPRAVLRIWPDEFESALDDRRHMTYTMHPEGIGRVLHATAARVHRDHLGTSHVWSATHADVAAHVTALDQSPAA